MNRIFVTVITTVVITITQPVRLHANIRFGAFMAVGRTGGVLRTPVMRFVCSSVVLAVVDAVANLIGGKTQNKEDAYKHVAGRCTGHHPDGTARTLPKEHANSVQTRERRRSTALSIS